MADQNRDQSAGDESAFFLEMICESLEKISKKMDVLTSAVTLMIDNQKRISSGERAVSSSAMLNDFLKKENP